MQRFNTYLEFLMAPHNWRGLRPWKRHSLVLLVAGLVYVGIGTAYILIEQTPSRTVALYAVLNWSSFRFWGGVFMFAGFLSIISSRWPPISRTWGYVVLTGLAAGWGTVYLVSILFFHSPWGNISGALIWWLIGFMWWAISGLRNPGEEKILEEMVQAIRAQGRVANED